MGKQRFTQRIIIWRHGQTDWNTAGRYQGQTDTDLNETGREQASVAADILQKYEPTHLYASDLKRAHDTAKALEGLTGLSTVTDQRLRETNLGRWQGLTRKEAENLYPEEYSDWIQRKIVAIEGGESQAQLRDRASSFLQQHTLFRPEGTTFGDESEDMVSGAMGVSQDTSVGSQDESTIIIATHGATARVLIALLLGLPDTVWHHFEVLGNARWSQFHLNHQGKWRLMGHNLGDIPA